MFMCICVLAEALTGLPAVDFGCVFLPAVSDSRPVSTLTFGLPDRWPRLFAHVDLSSTVIKNQGHRSRVRVSKHFSEWSFFLGRQSRTVFIIHHVVGQQVEHWARE